MPSPVVSLAEEESAEAEAAAQTPVADSLPEPILPTAENPAEQGE